MAIEMADFVIEDTKQTELEVACFKAMRKLENEMKYVRWAQQTAKRARNEYKALVAKYEAYLEENR